MEELLPTIGRVVYSKSGRDAGRYFIICGLCPDGCVLIADGNLRRLDKPKKKKLRHLTLTHDVLESIAAKLAEGKKVFDKEIGSALRAYGKE